MYTPVLDALIIFILTTPLIGLIGKKIDREKIVVGAYTTFAFIFSLIIMLLYSNEGVIVYGHSPSSATGFFNSFRIFMALIFVTIGITASIFSIKEDVTGSITGYFTLLLGMITAMIGIAFSGDLFILFIFWEAMCICSYALVAFKKEQWESIEASYKYLIMSSAGGITILFALSFLYGLGGSLNISDLTASLAATGNNPLSQIALLMLIVGFGLQAGMVPFHTWLPDAHMAAPNAVSAVLSGIMVKTGIYGLCTALFVIFMPMRQLWQTPLAAFAILTMFIGNLSALTQDDIKRLLAFSTIANTGYILLGLSIASEAALTGSLLHMLNHAITKTLLFLCAGTFIHRTKTRSLKELAGLSRSMPIISAMFVVGALSLTGIPPLNIFWSELLIILSSLEAGMPFLAFLMLINIIFSGAYCLRLIQMVTRKNQKLPLAKNQTSIFMLIPILILGFLIIFIGLFPLPFQNFAETAAQALLNP